MSKILYVATVVKTHIMEFHIPYLKMLKEMGWKTAVAAKNDYENPADCVIPYCDTYYNIPFERNPLKPKNIQAYKQLKQIIDEGSYDIIHCHTPVGAMLTRLAAQDARRKGSKVIYTAHGFHFYKGAPLLNWMIYYPVEKYLARKTDVLITINKEDYGRAQKFKTNHVEYVPGVGVDLKRFKEGNPEMAKKLRGDLGIPNEAIVLLSVGEVNTNKNHKVVIDALPDIPNTWYVLCGQGPLIDEYKSKAKALGIENRVVFAGYRTDIENYYNMADYFVFPSIREGLPVALMEAMAADLVCIASKNRGTEDLLPFSKLKFNAKDVMDLVKVIFVAMNEDNRCEIERNKEHLAEFDIKNTVQLMKTIYYNSI